MRAERLRQWGGTIGIFIISVLVVLSIALDDRPGSNLVVFWHRYVKTDKIPAAKMIPSRPVHIEFKETMIPVPLEPKVVTKGVFGVTQDIGLNDKTPPKPEINGIFLEATSPGVAIENLTEDSVVRDAMLVISAWNLDTKESLPTFSHIESEMFIKSGKGVILGSCDNPSMRGHIKKGDKVFAYVEIDCPNCARIKRYWMFFEYGGSSWYSPIPDKGPVDMLNITNLLYKNQWNFDAVWAQLPHGDRLPPIKSKGL